MTLQPNTAALIEELLQTVKWDNETNALHARAATALRDQEAEIRRLEERVLPEWQPIETAPKNGTRILLIRIGYDDAAICGSWDFYNEDYAWQDDARHFDFIGYPPTHWMLLPKPSAKLPEQKKEGTDE